MFVKICGLTDPEDALLAAGLGANAVGMILTASPRRVTMGSAHDIVRRLPPEIMTVGVFRNDGKERVVELTNKLGLQAVQLHGDETPETTRWVAERVPHVIRAFAYDDPALNDRIEYGPHRLLIDAPEPGSGVPFDWTALPPSVQDQPFILAGGLTADNVAEAIRRVAPWGVDVATGVESEPGRKDPAKVRRFLAAVREVAPEVERPDGHGMAP